MDREKPELPASDDPFAGLDELIAQLKRRQSARAKIDQHLEKHKLDKALELAAREGVNLYDKPEFWRAVRGRLETDRERAEDLQKKADKLLAEAEKAHQAAQKALDEQAEDLQKKTDKLLADAEKAHQAAQKALETVNKALTQQALLNTLTQADVALRELDLKTLEKHITAAGEIQDSRPEAANWLRALEGDLGWLKAIRKSDKAWPFLKRLRDKLRRQEALGDDEREKLREFAQKLARGDLRIAREGHNSRLLGLWQQQDYLARLNTPATRETFLDNQPANARLARYLQTGHIGKLEQELRSPERLFGQDGPLTVFGQLAYQEIREAWKRHLQERHNLQTTLGQVNQISSVTQLRDRQQQRLVRARLIELGERLVRHLSETPPEIFAARVVEDRGETYAKRWQDEFELVVRNLRKVDSLLRPDKAAHDPDLPAEDDWEQYLGEMKRQVRQKAEEGQRFFDRFTVEEIQPPIPPATAPSPRAPAAEEAQPSVPSEPEAVSLPQTPTPAAGESAQQPVLPQAPAVEETQPLIASKTVPPPQTPAPTVGVDAQQPVPPSPAPAVEEAQPSVPSESETVPSPQTPAPAGDMRIARGETLPPRKYNIALTANRKELRRNDKTTITAQVTEADGGTPVQGIKVHFETDCEFGPGKVADLTPLEGVTDENGSVRAECTMWDAPSVQKPLTCTITARLDSADTSDSLELTLLPAKTVEDAQRYAHLGYEQIEASDLEHRLDNLQDVTEGSVASPPADESSDPALDASTRISQADEGPQKEEERAEAPDGSNAVSSPEDEDDEDIEDVEKHLGLK